MIIFERECMEEIWEWVSKAARKEIFKGVLKYGLFKKALYNREDMRDSFFESKKEYWKLKGKYPFMETNIQGWGFCLGKMLIIEILSFKPGKPYFLFCLKPLRGSLENRMEVVNKELPKTQWIEVIKRSVWLGKKLVIHTYKNQRINLWEPLIETGLFARYFNFKGKVEYKMLK